MADEGGERRTILLVEEDDETRRLLARNLRGYGYRVITALDEEDALERVAGGGTRADLVLVDLVGKGAGDGLEVGRRVRDRARRAARTPLVVMPERYGKGEEGTQVNVGGDDWVFYLGEEPGQLREFLGRLLPAAS